MFADFYIHKLSNDMKIAVQKNNLGGQIWDRSLEPVKKRSHFVILEIFYFSDFHLCLNWSQLSIIRNRQF